MQNNELLNHLDKIHTTELGVVRIKRNLALDTDHVVDWCRNRISSVEASISRKGKNWYIAVNGCIIRSTLIVIRLLQHTGQAINYQVMRNK